MNKTFMFQQKASITIWQNVLWKHYLSIGWITTKIKQEESVNMNQVIQYATIVSFNWKYKLFNMLPLFY